MITSIPLSFQTAAGIAEMMGESPRKGRIAPLVPDDSRVVPMVADDNDFELPAACPLRNNGDETCEACQ